MQIHHMALRPKTVGNNFLRQYAPRACLMEDTHMAKLKINGRVREVTAEADTPLLWVIREHVGLTGTKYGCGIAQCGACSVHFNGEVQRSCQIPFGQITESDKIVTIEGLSADRSHPVQKAWASVDVPQCGYCQSGQIMAAAALLKKTPKPSDKDIDDAMTNICRCGTYQRIREAIHMAAGGETVGRKS
jgi:isoquinoline 1-oxidoreductase alpha subunit